MDASQAWRQHFSKNAADILSIYKWADGMTDEEFKHVLIVCFGRRPNAQRINERTVLFVLQAREDVKRDLREQESAQ